MLHICVYIHKPKLIILSDIKAKNLLFDLGGVILPLNVDNSMQAFRKLAKATDFPVADILAHPLMVEYEMGKIDDLAFRNGIRSLVKQEAMDDLLDEGWNSMLLGIPLKALKLLKTLRSQYNLYLLSNTNAIHLKKINAFVAEHFPENELDDFFEKAYYSHLLGMRKPDPAIFEHVLHDAGLIAGETLFLDDNPHNIAAANGVGIDTFHITQPEILFDIFKDAAGK